MKFPHRTFAFSLLVSVGLATTFVALAQAQSATQVAGQLSAQQQGSSYVRLRMENQSGGGKSVLQVLIKERRSGGSSELLYQILFPKERKGESVLLRRGAGGALSGVHFTPPSTVRNLSASQMKEPLFGGALAYEDVIDNFFSWSNQTFVGTETVGRTECQILESKPGKGERSSYSSVRTWLDIKRMVPLRIEKYRGGQVAKRIDTTDVARVGGRHLPANMTVRSGSAVTMLDGSRIKNNVSFTDREFTPEGMADLTIPRSAEE